MQIKIANDGSRQYARLKPAVPGSLKLMDAIERKTK